MSDLELIIAFTMRVTAVGSTVCIRAAVSAMLASYISCNVEKRASRNGDECGHGAVEGIAAPETANDAAAQTWFIPTLTLGVLGWATMATMIAAMVETRPETSKGRSAGAPFEAIRSPSWRDDDW